MSGTFTNKIAKQAAEHYAREGTYMPLPAPLPYDMSIQKACYVSIIEQPGNRVRGWFGTPLPRTTSLAQEIIYNTVEAIVRNNIRMRAVDAMQYGYIVSVLGPIERITNKEHLQPNMYGLYLRTDKNKTALLLPRRFGVDTPEEQIATAMRESGADPRHEAITMYRFPVTSYGP
jgi:AMMECR1